MPWLLCDGRAVASAEIAAGHRARLRGLLGRDGIEGVLALPGVRGVHTLGMRFAVDVAFVGADDLVLAAVRMAPWRLGRTRWAARLTIEAEAGSFERWGVRPGACVTIEGGGGTEE